ncbi:MAG: hypothetical protein IJ866_02150 [Alphaproteobacteria bacterium]|jgi:hypothetical protein|nr:hypothetical protein [Alphaproteobacteria bacterium]
MFGKVKKVFFTGVFGILYVGFLAQLVYILGWSASVQEIMFGLAGLSLEWLILIAARYLSKRSSGAAQYNNNGGFRRR